MQRKFSLSLKFLAMVFSFSLPLITPFRFMIQEQNKAMEFAELEKKGSILLNSFSDLFEELQNHRIAVELFHSKSSLYNENELTNSVKGMEHALEQVAENLANHGAILQFTEEGLKKFKRENLTFLNLKDSWKATLSASINGSIEVRNKGYLALSDLIKGFYTHIGDTSNLILDPDLDSYYTMDSVLLGIPQLQSRLVDAYVLALQSASKKNEGLSNSMHGTLYSTLLKMDSDRVFSSVSTALNSDINYFGKNEELQSLVRPGSKIFSIDFENAFSSFQKSMNESSLSIGAMKQGKQLVGSSFKFWKENNKALQTLLQSRISDYQSKQNTSAATVVLIWLLSCVVGFYLRNSILKPVEVILQRMQDLSQETKETSVQIFESSHKASDAANSEASAIQQTVAAMAEMTSMLGQTAVDVQNANEVAESVLQIADEGTKTMEIMSNSMNSIAHDNASLKDIKRIIEGISQKTNVINDIVFKTQLLAVNASIEAARAGNHGRGFAVVASEVSNLAAVSGKAASEIKTLLDESRIQVSDILQNTESSVNKGQVVCNDARKTFNSISDSISKIFEKVAHINEATKEQSTAIRQTSVAMDQLNLTTASNLRFAHENELLGKKLNEQANSLNVIGEDMCTVVFGGSVQKSIDLPETEKKVKSKINFSKHAKNNANEADNFKEKQSKTTRHDLAKKIISKSFVKNNDSVEYKNVDGDAENSENKISA